MEQQERIECRGSLLRPVEPDAQLAAGKQVEHVDGKRILQLRILLPKAEEIPAVEQFTQPLISPCLSRGVEPAYECHEEEQHPPNRRKFHGCPDLQMME